jgi:hypothetical protein
METQYNEQQKKNRMTNTYLGSTNTELRMQTHMIGQSDGHHHMQTYTQMYVYLLFDFVHKAVQYIVCRVSLVEQKLLTLPEHLISLMLFTITSFY